jgi:hypothetical protein
MCALRLKSGAIKTKPARQGFERQSAEADFTYSLPARRIPILEATQKRSLFLFSEIIEYKYLASASTSS